jgi:hypothetical protein
MRRFRFLTVSVLVLALCAGAAACAGGEERRLNEITVSALPYKTAYAAGETFVPTGLALSAVYTDSTTPVTVSEGYDYYPKAPLTVSDTAVLLSVGGKTTLLDITVSAAGVAPNPDKTLTGIAVKTPAQKTVYTEGERFSSAGLVLTGTYSDGSIGDITGGYTFMPTAPLTVFDTSVTIACRGLTAAVAVRVTRPVGAVESVSMSRTEYTLTLRGGEDSVKLSALILPFGAGGLPVWTTTDELVAAVDQNGLVTAGKVGVATITAKAADGSMSADCVITVNAPAG